MAEKYFETNPPPGDPKPTTTKKRGRPRKESSTKPVKDMAEDTVKVSTASFDVREGLIKPIKDTSLTGWTIADLVAAQEYILNHECRKARGDRLAIWGKRREDIKAEIQQRIIEAVG